MAVATTNKDENVFISLLLEAVRSYKSKCEYEGVNWEIVRSKYEDINSIFIEKNPSNVNEENKNNGNKEQFPRIGTAETIGNERNGAKLRRCVPTTRKLLMLVGKVEGSSSSHILRPL